MCLVGGIVMSEDVKNVLDEQFENEIEDTVVEVDDEEVDLEELSNEVTNSYK